MLDRPGSTCLSVNSPTGRPAVLNAGVPGYGTAQELLFMRELLQRHRVRPDLVVLVFFTNDILDNLCLSYANLAPQPSRPCFTLHNDALYLTQRPQKKIDAANDAGDR